MTVRKEVSGFLVSRRSRLTHEAAGLENTGGVRKVPGLRREEVAVLAGISLEYYVRLERGNIAGVSEQVLHALAKALHLSDVEREYLFDLAHRVTHRTGARGESGSPQPVWAAVLRMVHNLTVPAFVRNSTQDIVAANLMGQAMYAPIFDSLGTPNTARFVFLDQRARSFYTDWPGACDTTAAILRFEAGRDPLNTGLTSLIAELGRASSEFRASWKKQDVHEHRTGIKEFRHPQVGVIEVSFDVFETPGDAHLKVVTYSPVPGSATAEKFALLSSWAANTVLPTGVPTSTAESRPGEGR